jgi:hypothetical protein
MNVSLSVYRKTDRCTSISRYQFVMTEMHLKAPASAGAYDLIKKIIFVNDVYQHQNSLLPVAARYDGHTIPSYDGDRYDNSQSQHNLTWKKQL